VSSYDAIFGGRLANKPQFFGTATAETVANAASAGSWNGDFAETVHATLSWFNRGSYYSTNRAEAGVFSFGNNAGGASNLFGHRTILSGY
jgi:hypothetical protein